ncbi:MAG: site-specific integrase [Solirubrobacterales bacterium]|nr:site-specific integrase [Solirubrobacterales bacterium]
MAGAKLEKTRWPGIYRRGDRWASEFTDAGGQRRRASAGSREDASARKADEEAKAARGDLPDTGGRSRATVAGYALELFGADLDRDKGSTPARGRYAGRRGAIRPQTLDEYRRDLERHVLPVIGDRPLAKVRAPDLARLAAGLAARDGEDYLADRSVRRIFAPLSALFATAVEEGFIAHNPVRDVNLPSGRDRLRKFDADDQGDDDDPAPGHARALTREQLATVLAIVDPRWRVFFELLASTGLRVSEALALRWGDVRLDGSNPAVKVRRAYVKGAYGPPKSRHGRRDVPLPFGLVTALRERRAGSEWPDARGLVFPSLNGTPMSAENLARRTLKPAVQEAGAGWAGFHAFRHFCASQLIADGRNIVQTSRWLGHHSPAFTLTVYAHLIG